MVVTFLLVCFLLSVGSLLSRTLESDFYSELQIDEIIYTSVAVPRGANSVEIQLWCEESDTIKPILYLKYNGLPTLTDYDWHMPLPSLPDAIRIHDIQPTQSVLYIGIHGGKLLNSYYYFASEPTYILVGVDVTVEKCSNSMVSGVLCDSVFDTLPLSLIDLSMTAIDVPINDGVEYALIIPSNIEGITISVSLPSIPSELCDILLPESNSHHYQSQSVTLTDQSHLAMIVDVYLDQPEEDLNSARHLLLVDYRPVCEGLGRGAQVDVPVSLQDVEIPLRYPLGGMWKVSVQLLHSAVGTSNSSSSGENTERNLLQRRLTSNKLFFEIVPYRSKDQVKAARQVKATATATEARDRRVSAGGVDDDVLSGLYQSVTITTKVDDCVDGMTGFYDGTITTARSISSSSSSSSSSSGSDGELRDRRHVEDADYLSCRSGVYPLSASRTSSVALGYRSYRSETVQLLLQDSNTTATVSGDSGSGSRRQPVDYVLFAADLSDVSQLPEVGGVMQVQLKLVLPQTLMINTTSSSSSNSSSTSTTTENDVAAILGAFQDLHFLVSLRIGGRPFDPNEDLPSYRNATEEARKQQDSSASSASSSSSSGGDVEVLQYGYTTVVSPSAYVLSSRYAIVKDSTLSTTRTTGSGGDESSGGDSNDDESYRAPTRRRRTSTGLRISTSPDLSLSRDHNRGEYQYVWTLPKPALPGLLGTAGGDSEGGSGSKLLYLHVTFERDTVHKSLDDSHLRELFNQLSLSVKVLFMPCSVSSCVHGTCLTHRGDIDSSTCFCKFPWGGEKCDQLIMSHWFYSIQVSLLVLSNLAMIPGILYCYHCCLPVLMTALIFASLSSAFYHLCDTDTYCIADMSFQSLQVMDILFCTACMASMLLFYAPVTRSTHSTLLVLSAALLVTPVANQPTNALNIVCAIAGSVLLCVLLWINHLLVVHNCTLHSFYRCCCGSSSTGTAATATAPSKRRRRQRRSKYLIVPSSEDPEVDSTSHGSSSIEMTSVSSSNSNSGVEGTFATKNVFVLNRQQPDVESSFASIESRYSQNDFRGWELWITNCVLDLPANLYDCRYSLVGVALALSGLGFFAFQTRESYWFMHSMWHLLVMLSSYFLVRGRFDFMNVVEYTDPENPPFLVSELED